jgi:predicted nucleic acid-binding protein
VILVDTSAWIDHFRRRDDALIDLLRTGRVATCEVVRTELRLGAGVPREVAPLLSRLPDLALVETRSFLDNHAEALVAAGIGYADLLILACAVAHGARLRTTDGPLRRAWGRLQLQPG